MTLLRSSFLNLNRRKALILIILVLVIDQVSKMYIKLNFPLSVYGGNAIVDWGVFKILFIENKGMAWGTKISDIVPFISEEVGKLILTLFRLVAIAFLGNWLWKILSTKSSQLLIWALCLIFAGAIGNIIDSVFYGIWFSHSYGQIAEFMPEQGYASLFYGHVVDMLQFPLATWIWPTWVPFVGGESYTFFEYVFNIADFAISCGVGILLFFNKRIFG
ncbi:lipoprotein signal peptidase [Flavobacteriaceae bacterium]|jgi:signal peptidase II|uniref:lipoprotein signal peptidase n=1 Tax=Candidatus Arcticimaribacter forsetii TaxID=2820661 RepID=UPI0020775703|nr:lipoprotein signal peptidase [Candidatus Arcticimaribacter forsetii]MCH1538639.1 lipoprotein signal peptidase [Flavobacteriaceae bacterium]MDA8639881.1 lipoprotein signal peptidase [Flavobacteriaceae bacterium]MDA8698529.1 lipoprotein signal peptidase [Flavobacteriaceae bacterium]MDB2325776.1 lipoprotein signal peptidase [Flavobacteriaceae bacterium]MDB2456596.1 lipoprotein signal peptidase [Flavobacteriaceae bacterium]